MLIRPKKPSREELAKIFKDPRTLKAFEQVFEILPGEINRQDENLDDIQFQVESAAAQGALAIALIHAVEALAEVKAMEPAHQCNCQHDDLTPRYEHVTPDQIELAQIHHHEISTLEIV
ncbi:hypothetical protein [Acinetobacter lwoffii]|uniref:hypothetical protein n=1 Tax=Acinetobacter lwoffii TaxID=28090 RepID=UPI002DB94DE9|nr:hypothetical protein [Acinetobacter lwoffii]MEB6681034.1 hypothetical protein [Acinetobacter lwoffii]